MWFSQNYKESILGLLLAGQCHICWAAFWTHQELMHNGVILAVCTDICTCLTISQSPCLHGVLMFLGQGARTKTKIKLVQCNFWFQNTIPLSALLRSISIDKWSGPRLISWPTRGRRSPSKFRAPSSCLAESNCLTHFLFLFILWNKTLKLVQWSTQSNENNFPAHFVLCMIHVLPLLTAVLSWLCSEINISTPWPRVLANRS